MAEILKFVYVMIFLFYLFLVVTNVNGGKPFFVIIFKSSSLPYAQPLFPFQ